MTATAQDVDILLTTGATYTYPITSMFAFDQRAGNGTAIETVSAPAWNVYYGNGRLHFTEQVNNVAIYGISGVLMAKFVGSTTDMAVSLAQGVYIVQAGGKTAKLLVTSNGSSGTNAQSTVVKEAPSAVYTPNASDPVTPLRAATAALKQYWNINAGNVITPIEIAKVNEFYITPNNDIVFSMKDGNTIQFANYQGTSFSTQPTQSQNTGWDRETTILYGGASYLLDFSTDNVYDICVIAVAKDYVVAEGV
jgi:hypothetical protein